MARRSVSFVAALICCVLWFCASAQAQGVQCLQTPAIGTSNTTCANTAFVQKQIAASTSSSSDHPIAHADCNTIFIENGAFKTITLPSLPASGFPTDGCHIRIVNGNTSRAQALSGFPSGLPAGCGAACLYPTQSLDVAISGGSWIFTRLPPRYQPPAGFSLFVDPSGSDNNDGLATGATGGLLSINTALKRWNEALDCSRSSPFIQLDAGNQVSDLTGILIAYAAGCGGAGEVTISGANAGGHASVVIWCNGGVQCISVQEPATLQLTGVTLHPQGNGTTDLFVRQGATSDVSDVQFDPTPLGIGINVLVNAHFNTTGNLIINGAVPSFLQCNFHSYCSFQGVTVTINGNYTITNFLTAANGAIIDSAAGVTFAGAGAGIGTTGTQCTAISNGIIHTGGTTYPGNAGTCNVTASQGQILNP